MIDKKNNPIRSVWLITREYDRLAGAGGVKDVCRQLAEAMASRDDCAVRVVLPRYGFMDPSRLGFALFGPGDSSGRIAGRRYEQVFEVDMNYATEERRETVAIWTATINKVTVFLIEADRFAAKRGVYTYTEEDEQEVAWQRAGAGHFDYFAMNVLLQKVALDLMILFDEKPDIVHCHDGHAAILPAMMRENQGLRLYFRKTGALVTVHNAGVGYHQEVDDLEFARAITGLPRRVIMGSRLGNSFDPFLAASEYAVLNTVSENYGRELQETQEDRRTGGLGHALMKRGVRLWGITNGIDPGSFDPTQPEQLGLAAGFDIRAGEMAGKKHCKRALLGQLAATHHNWGQVKQFGTLNGDEQIPLFTFIGRLTAQKGVDILIETFTKLLPRGEDRQVVVFGSGSAELEKQIETLATSEQGWGKICFLKGYDPLLANQVYAAGDFFLIPSRYEPCGLTDYIAQLLGNLPIVHRVGGLIKVIDEQTGFAYSENTPATLSITINRAQAVYSNEPDRMQAMQRAAVERIDQFYTWDKVMDGYYLLYQQAIQRTGRK